ncbi:hypothetical protein Emag_005860 [Eimeria magna]
MDVQRRRQRRGAQPSEQPKRFARRPGSQKPLKGGGHGGKRVKHNAEDEAVLPGRKRRQLDEEIESDSMSENESVPSADNESDEGEETTDEARLRVARQYLRQFAEAAEGGFRVDGATAASRKANGLEADPAFESTGEDSADAEGETDEEASGDDLFLNADEKAAVAEQLKRKAGEKKLLSRTLSSVASGLSFKPSSFFRGHKLPVTCVALPAAGGTEGFGGSAGSSQQHAYTGGKDCCVIRWDLETGSKEIFKGQRNCFGGGLGKPGGKADTGQLSGHFRPVLDLCVAPDERLFFSAGADHTIRAWDPRASNARCMFELRGHRGPVTGVRFNGEKDGGGHEGEAELVSCSADKSLKTWSLSCRSVANHFYGHATEVNCIDLLQPDKPVTGGSDGTLRSWKDTHAAFPPMGSCVDSVAMLSPSLFCCGTQGGLLSLFNSSFKKPLACVRVDALSGAEKIATAQPRAPLRATGAATSVSALCALRLTDALLVGTEGGAVQLWAATQHDRKAGGGSLTAIPGAAAQTGGVVTGLCVSKDNSFAVAAVSTESRLGRWHKSEGAKNGIRVIPFANS